MASVLVPVLYVFIVFGSLFAFSSWYRRRNANKIYEPYFPQHRERDVYVTLLQKTDPPASETLLKAALVRRAMTDVHRIMRLREDKPALQVLLQKGSIGDDLWNSLLAAEKELEAEILEVAAEANTFVEGWGQIIFQTATEMIHNERMRGILEQIPVLKAANEKKFGRVTSKPIPLPTGPIRIPVSGAPKTPQTPASASSALPETPISAATSNGLLSPSPSTPATDGNVVSDHEGPRTPTSQRSLSKASGKKMKKRK